jgi:hypothetical protein
MDRGEFWNQTFLHEHNLKQTLIDPYYGCKIQLKVSCFEYQKNRVLVHCVCIQSASKKTIPEKFGLADFAIFC